MPEIEWPRHTFAYISAYIRNERRRQGLTLVELADLTGLSKTLIGAVEKGRKEPTLDVLFGVLYVLDVKQGDIFLRQINDLARRARAIGVQREKRALEDSLFRPPKKR